MERPDDIPEDVWQKAMLTEEACINETWNGSAAGSKQKSATIIAHAMLAAVNEERERCARIADSKILPGRFGMTGPFPDVIARAIRTGYQPKDNKDQTP